MLFAVVVVASSCSPAPLPGAPKLGSACESSAARECYTEASIAFCDGGKWAEYPCENRCSNAQDPKCTLEKRHPGEPCPVSWEGYGQCDGNDMLTCVSGKWELKSHCSVCEPFAGGLRCVP